MSNDFRINIRSPIKTYSSFIRLKQLLKDKCTLFPTQKLELETWLISKEGKIKEHKKQTAHSFTINWLKVIEGCCNHVYSSVGISDVGALDTSGSSYPLNFTTNTTIGTKFAVLAPAGTYTYGISCGTGTTSVRADDYCIESQIAHGSGEGQLNYGTMGVTGASGSESECQLSFSRTVGNASGSSITVKNIGLLYQNVTGATNKAYLAIHDNCNQTIAPGETWLILYTIKTSISS